jgi:hypothetical protein
LIDLEPATMATPPPDDPNQKGRLQPTRPATLAVVALATTALAWVGISNFYNEMPTLPWLPPLTLFGLAIVEAFAAYTTKNRIDRKAGAPPVQPLVVARYLVLAKASAVAAALFGGLYAGLTTWLLSMRGTLLEVSHDLPQAVIGLGGSLALLTTALWLERACRVPPPPRDKDQPRVGRHVDEDDRAEDGQSA